jgi:hypothetical protein
VNTLLCCTKCPHIILLANITAAVYFPLPAHIVTNQAEYRMIGCIGYEVFEGSAYLGTHAESVGDRTKFSKIEVLRTIFVVQYLLAILKYIPGVQRR